MEVPGGDSVEVVEAQARDMVLELLAAGMSPEEIAGDYRISVKDVKAALLYAAKVLGREEVLIGTQT